MVRARYKQVVDSFAEQIRSGKLRPGTRLPTHRKLAASYDLALVTATRVYAELSAMGLVTGETGRGTFVREIALPLNQGIDQQAIADDVVDLNFNYPSLPGQTDMLRSALQQLMTSGDLESLLRYQPHAGRLHDRATIAHHLLRRDIEVTPENILIVDGAQHGLATSIMALFKSGDVIAVDALTYPGFKILAELYNLELVPISADGRSLDLNYLEQLCKKRKVRAVYVQPTIHNPLGWVMDLAKREALVSMARRYGLLILEDAPYAFLDEHPPLPLASLAPELTIYISGFSKSVATGLRVGFIAAPIDFVSRIERAIRATTWNTPAIMTSLACNWINDGTVARLESEKRQDAHARQLIFTNVFNEFEYMSHPHSYFAWLPLPEETRADKVVSELMIKKISVSTASPFSTTHQAPHAIRLALGSVNLKTLKQALETVKYVIEKNMWSS